MVSTVESLDDHPGSVHPCLQMPKNVGSLRDRCLINLPYLTATKSSQPFLASDFLGGCLPAGSITVLSVFVGRVAVPYYEP